MVNKAKTLLYCIGDLEDGYLDEVFQSRSVAPGKKIALYGALGLAATIGVIFAFRGFRKLATS
ncbi:MAG: hypothetical protein LBE35_00870 [Clostridiales bacterium]|jgi:hypothetical protein|nr:hypothetical protein [Clostridiales bacterium]